MIKTVIFDLGKVLVDFDYGIAARKIAARGKMPADQFTHFISQSPLFFRYETGLLTTEQFYAEICVATGFCGQLDEFGQCFADIFVPIPAMVELQAALRKAGLPAYIFSNTNELAVGHIRRAFPFFANFDGYIFSFEQRMMKPHAGIYEITERITGHRTTDLVYIDDRAENLAPAALRKWHVIHHRSADQTI